MQGLHRSYWCEPRVGFVLCAHQNTIFVYGLLKAIFSVQWSGSPLVHSTSLLLKLSTGQSKMDVLWTVQHVRQHVRQNLPDHCLSCQFLDCNKKCFEVYFLQLDFIRVKGEYLVLVGYLLLNKETFGGFGPIFMTRCSIQVIRNQGNQLKIRGQLRKFHSILLWIRSPVNDLTHTSVC